MRALALPTTEDLEHTAIENRPELAALRKQLAKSRDQGLLTRLAMKPDFTAALGYMLMPTGSTFRNAYMAELTMNLPSLNRERHEGEAKQADAATDISQAEVEARTSSVFLEIRQAQIDVLAAQKRVKLYRDTLLPQAEATFKASAAAYQNNRGEFANLIESQNLLLDIQAAYYKASAASDTGIAELERAIGAALPAAPGSRKDKQMIAREKKLIALGAGAGVLAAALVIGILAARELPSLAAGGAMPAASPQLRLGLTRGRARNRAHSPAPRFNSVHPKSRRQACRWQRSEQRH